MYHGIYVVQHSNTLCQAWKHEKYDGLRNELLDMLLWLCELRETFVLLTSDEELKWTGDESLSEHHVLRFLVLPDLAYKIFNVLQIVTEPCVHLSRLMLLSYISIAILEHDLDMIANFDLEFEDGKKVCFDANRESRRQG